MVSVFLSLIDSESDKEKFTELYNTYKDLLYWIALRKTNSVEDSEECVQETFFYVAKHFEKISDVKSKRTKGYLSAIVTGFAIDIYNNSKKANTVSLDDEDSADIQYYEDFEKISENHCYAFKADFVCDSVRHFLPDFRQSKCLAFAAVQNRCNHNAYLCGARHCDDGYLRRL